ncbi:MAG: hypothetical protein J6D53_09535 [Blautia sp.]|nr:hypothetical protein [Blautia sp.]
MGKAVDFVEKKAKKKARRVGRFIVWTLLVLMVGICIGIHRKVIKAMLTGSEMPEAPEWHFWVK